jgi:restriction system protein
VVGITAAMPLVVVGCIAAWRQWRAPSSKTVARVLESAASMGWREFSDAVENAFVRDGYTVTRLKGAGADFSLLKNQRLVLVSCKRWKASSNGIVPLRELVEEGQRREARETMFLTLGELSEQARRYAIANKVGVLQGAGLGKLLRNIAAPDRAAA